MKQAVIYRIVNSLNGHMYIGSTTAYRKRKSNHFGMLRSGNHHSSHLQRAYNKYGSENFYMEVIESFDFIDSEHLSAREQYYVDNFKADYNVRVVDVCSPRGIKASEATIEKMRKAQSKLVYKINLDGTCEEFPSIEGLSIALGMSGSYPYHHLRKAVTQEGIIEVGYIISHDRNAKLEDYRKTIRRGNNQPEKKVSQFALDGTLVRHWNSVRHIMSETDYKDVALYLAVRKGVQRYGYLWRATKDEQP